ncbi:MAG TPA: hypothetical protein VMF59_09180 [Bacteroidota bacterium]|nr:hypothetical protein [Bacteroidota bacterium]
MGSVQHGFHYAWESLLLDFEEILVGSAATDASARGGSLVYPVFDRPFSIVKFFHHPRSEMGLELRADGYRAVLSMFRQDPLPGDEAPGAEPAEHAEIGTEIGNVSVNYDELLDAPDDVRDRLLLLLPQGA